MSQNNTVTRNKFRIIAGQWRGRTLPFADVEDIRPTPDRVRETLFNWLQNTIVGAHCLDLFAGSGALGLEALSRGAASVSCIEKSTLACRQIRDNGALLKSDSLQVHNNDALESLKTENSGSPFNIVFLDPPFGGDFYEQCCQLLQQNNYLANDALIYLESNRPLENLTLPPGWKIFKEKKAGQVHFGLAKQP